MTRMRRVTAAQTKPFSVGLRRIRVIREAILFMVSQNHWLFSKVS
jgi:hypothetical protein